MQLTIGPSIYGDNWFRDLKLRIADMADKYQNTYIYGVGINLYGAEKPDYFEGSLMEPDVLMNSIWEIVKEQPVMNQETARLGLIEERGLKDEVQGYHQSKDETPGNHQSKDEVQGYHQSKAQGYHQSKDEAQSRDKTRSYHQSKDDTQGNPQFKDKTRFLSTSNISKICS